MTIQTPRMDGLFLHGTEVGFGRLGEQVRCSGGLRVPCHIRTIRLSLRDTFDLLNEGDIVEWTLKVLLKTVRLIPSF